MGSETLKSPRSPGEERRLVREARAARKARINDTTAVADLPDDPATTEYSIQDAWQVYQAFVGECMEMNEARLTTMLGTALHFHSELQKESAGLTQALSIARCDIERLHAPMDGEASVDPNQYCRTCVSPNGRSRVYPCRTLKVVRVATQQSPTHE